MGLDIYLYRFHGNPEEIIANENTCSERTSETWDEFADGLKYEEIPEETKLRIRDRNKSICEEMGMQPDCDYYDKRREKIEVDSSKYPEHYFKIGYCRSSYNGSGFNRVVGNLGLMDLYGIWGYDRNSSDEQFSPDWPSIKERALATERGLRDIIANGNNFRATLVNANMFAGRPSISSEEEAIAVFLKKKRECADRTFSSFGCSDGEFWLDGLAIHAAIPGRASLGPDGVYLVFKDESLDWYAQACEIIAETCDYVLANPGEYRISWSG